MLHGQRLPNLNIDEINKKLQFIYRFNRRNHIDSMVEFTEGATITPSSGSVAILQIRLHLRWNI